MHKLTGLFTLALLPALSSATLFGQSTSSATPGVGAASSSGFPRQVIDSQPIAGLWMRTDGNSDLRTVSSDREKAEFRLNRGRLNVSVHQATNRAEVLIDLPQGQTTLNKDGFYTFNADTNTVRVLRGEAAAYPGAMNANAKPIKIGAHHQLAFAPGANHIRTVDAYPYELYADLLPLGSFSNDGHQGMEAQMLNPYGFPFYAADWGYPWDGFYSYPYAYGVSGYYSVSGGKAGHVRR